MAKLLSTEILALQRTEHVYTEEQKSSLGLSLRDHIQAHPALLCVTIPGFARASNAAVSISFNCFVSTVLTVLQTRWAGAQSAHVRARCAQKNV